MQMKLICTNIVGSVVIEKFLALIAGERVQSQWNFFSDFIV